MEGIPFLHKITRMVLDSDIISEPEILRKKHKVTDFKHPKELEEIFNLAIEDEATSQEDLYKFCQDVLKYSVKTCHPMFVSRLYQGVDGYGLAGAWLTEALNTNQNLTNRRWRTPPMTQGSLYWTDTWILAIINSLGLRYMKEGLTCIFDSFTRRMDCCLQCGEMWTLDPAAWRSFKDKFSQFQFRELDTCMMAGERRLFTVMGGNGFFPWCVLNILSKMGMRDCN